MPTPNPGTFRHQVDILLPPTALDARGQVTGDPTTVLEDVPCSIEQLAGLELIRAQKTYADATHRVTMFGDPGNPIDTKHYLTFGSRTLHVGAVLDEDNTGILLVLLCKEDV